MNRKLSAAVLTLCLSTAPLLAADPPPSQTVWHLSSFLQGTTSQVRDTVNGQLEGMLTRRADKTAEREKVKADIDARYAALGKGGDFAVPEKAVERGQSDLAAARAAGDSVALISAQNKLSAAQTQLHQQMSAVSAKDPQIAADQKQLDDLQTQIRQMEPAIANAVKARDQLIDGLRATLKLPGPPKDGNKGILGRIKPTKIVDATSLLCTFDAVQITGADDHPKNLPDGMKGMKGTLYKIQLLVTGIDTTPMKGKTEVVLDGRFELAGTQQMGRQKVFVAKPSTEKLPVDELLTALDDLHVPPGTGKLP